MIHPDTAPNEQRENPQGSLLFRIFTWVADADSTIDPYEAEVFLKMLKRDRWCKSKPVRNLLPMAADHYSKHWKSYQRGEIKRELYEIHEAIQLITTPLPPAEAAEVIDDLEQLANSIARASGGYFGLGSISKTEKRALNQLSVAFDRGLPFDATSRQGQTVPVESRSRADSTAGAAEIPAPGIAPASTGGSAAVSPLPGAMPGAQGWFHTYMPVAAVDPEQMTRWTKGKIEAQCIQVLEITHDVKSFRFVTDPPCLFTYKPGQFLTLELQIDGKNVLRSYTISSTPSRPHVLEITVKRASEGFVSNWLHDNLDRGDEVIIRGPSGRFNCFDHPSRKMLMLSGGSGITPVMSMARWVCDTAADCDVIFFHAARTPSDIVFRKELEMMEARHDNFHLHFLVSGADAEPNWSAFSGHIRPDILRKIAPDLPERAIYVCGPQGFMELCRRMAEDLGFSMQNYHEESFSSGPRSTSAPPGSLPGTIRNLLPTPKAPTTWPALNSGVAAGATSPGAPVQAAPHGTVHFSRSEREIDCDNESTILEIAELNGISIPSACRAGVCGTCKTLKTEGSVTMESTDGLEPGELEEGYILTCVSCVDGRVVVEA